jgi:hypothetical protein
MIDVKPGQNVYASGAQCMFRESHNYKYNKLTDSSQPCLFGSALVAIF